MKTAPRLRPLSSLSPMRNRANSTVNEIGPKSDSNKLTLPPMPVDWRVLPSHLRPRAKVLSSVDQRPFAVPILGTVTSTR